jgi:hypothetical protein
MQCRGRGKRGAKGVPAMPIQLSHGSEAGEQKKQKVVKEQKPKSKDWSSPLKFFPTCDLLGQPADFFDFFSLLPPARRGIVITTHSTTPLSYQL